MTSHEAKKIAVAYLVSRAKNDLVFENVIFCHEHGCDKPPVLLRHGPFGLTLNVDGREVDVCVKSPPVVKYPPVKCPVCHLALYDDAAKVGYCSDHEPKPVDYDDWEHTPDNR